MLGRLALSRGPRTDGFAGVSSSTMAQREIIAAEFDNCWPGYQGEAFANSYLATSSATLTSLFDALPVADLSLWYLIELDSTQPLSSWTSGVTLKGASGAQPSWSVGHYYGSTRDRSSAGGGVLIRSSDSSNPVMFTGVGTSTGVGYSGVRGVETRNVIFACTASAATTAERVNAKSVTVGSNATYKDGPVVRFVDCKIGALHNPATQNQLLCGKGIWGTGYIEQLDLVNCEFDGNDSALVTQGVKWLRDFGSDYQHSLLDNRQNLHTVTLLDCNSTWTEVCVSWFRMTTVRNPTDAYQLAQAHADADQIGTPADVGSYLILREFETTYAQRTETLDILTITPSTNPTEGQTMALGGVTYTFRAAPSGSTEILIGATRALTAVNVDAHFDTYNPPGGFAWSYAGNGFTVQYPAGEMTPAKMPVCDFAFVTTGSNRVQGGTQGQYLDDTTYDVDGVSICCMEVTNTGNGLRGWNGTLTIDRCLSARVGEMCASATVLDPGFVFTIDPEATINAGREAAQTVDCLIRNSVLGLCIDGLDGSYTNRSANGVYTGTGTTLTMTNNTFCSWKAAAVGNRPTDLLAGSFSTDGDGNISYTMDCTGSQAEFRQLVYNQLMLANTTDRASIGPTNPATWV